jgi:hypothetical protein
MRADSTRMEKHWFCTKTSSKRFARYSNVMCKKKGEQYFLSPNHFGPDPPMYSFEVLISNLFSILSALLFDPYGILKKRFQLIKNEKTISFFIQKFSWRV